MFAIIEIKKRRIYSMAVGASFGARLEHLRARKGTKETELAKAAILFYPKSAIFNRVAAEIFCVTQNRNCSPGLGAGASTSTKNHPLSGKENRWFCQSGYQVALLARLLFRLLCKNSVSGIDLSITHTRELPIEIPGISLFKAIYLM